MIRSALASARIWAFLALFSLAAGIGAQPSSVAGPKSSQTGVEVAKLAAARTALSKIKDEALLSSSLESYAFSLPAHDAANLFKEYIPKITGGKKSELASLGGYLALMVGRYEDAAFLFRQALRENPESGIDAARSYLAAGNVKEAKAVLELLQGQQYNASLEGKKKIILAWILLFEKKAESAFALLKDMVMLPDGGGKDIGTGQGSPLDPAGAAVEQEALFLLWVLASTGDIRGFSISSAGYEAAAMETLLAARYPRSAEAAIVRRGILPSPSPWLLSELFPFPGSKPAPSTAAGAKKPQGADSAEPPAGAGKPAAAGAQGQEGADAAKSPVAGAQGQQSAPSQGQPIADQAVSGSQAEAPSRLQVGWFSRKDNASGLEASLKKSGFKVAVEEQKTREGEARWAVIVDAEADWTKTQAKLKDLGYESYLLP
jgi:hypothetical protein